MQTMQSISVGFFKRDALVVAPALLGKRLLIHDPKNTLSATIVEVEAYRGDDDPASHAFGGMKNRNKPMFLDGGYVYVYFTYGAHYCLNFVTGKPGEGQAVLIRAVQPENGGEQMALNRFGISAIPTGKKQYTLTNGPGKLCSALGITKADNGIHITDGRIAIARGKTVGSASVGTSVRIGISKANDKPWRFYIKDNPWVSR
jgi:DNA-3-methyladenine glycosylase